MSKRSRETVKGNSLWPQCCRPRRAPDGASDGAFGDGAFFPTADAVDYPLRRTVADGLRAPLPESDLRPSSRSRDRDAIVENFNDC